MLARDLLKGSAVRKDAAQIRANIERNLQRGLPTPMGGGYIRREPMLIAGGGPSLKTTLRDMRRRKGRVTTSNLTHDWLLKRGVKPWGCVLLDAADWLKDHITPTAGVKYFVASQADPGLFDHLEGQEVYIWHARTNAGEADLLRHVPHYIGGGVSVSLRSINLGYLLGFRRFRLYGCDSSYDGGSHVYERTDIPEQATLTVEIGGKTFLTDAGMARQADDFLQQYLYGWGTGASHGNEPIDIRCTGPGLVPWTWRCWRDEKRDRAA